MVICYAIELIPLIFTSFEENIIEINIYSDLKMLQTLDESNNITSLFIKEMIEPPLINLHRILDNSLTGKAYQMTHISSKTVKLINYYSFNFV
jgi:hypothetical protein